MCIVSWERVSWFLALLLGIFQMTAQQKLKKKNILVSRDQNPGLLSSQGSALLAGLRSHVSAYLTPL